MFKKIVFSVMTLTAITLLFLDIGELFSQRLTQAVWPFGHLFVFAFWSYLLLHYHPKVKTATASRQFTILTVLCFTLGITIELIQPFFSRTAEISDLLLNYLGVLLSFVLFGRHALHYLLKFFFILASLLLLNTSVLSIYDEIKMQYDFPLLASFHQDIELTRWKADQTLSVEMVNDGAHASPMMKVTFAPRKYSGVALRYFPHNWTGYDTLTVDFYNPNEQTLAITTIITDQHYNKNKPNYKDRYEQALHIKQGFNKITIPLASIRDKVILRKMDLSKIAGVDFYMYKLTSPITVYVDTLYLQ